MAGILGRLETRSQLTVSADRVFYASLVLGTCSEGLPDLKRLTNKLLERRITENVGTGPYFSGYAVSQKLTAHTWSF